MKPSMGFELKASSASKGVPGIIMLLNSFDLKYTTFDCGFSFSSGPLMKIFVPPLKDANRMPLASSD